MERRLRMTNNFSVEEPIENKKSTSYLKPENLPDMYGTITGTIGTGEVAKDSIIYLVIKWCFISGSIITALLVINSWLFRTNGKVPDLTGDIRVAWNLIIPIITLALGYAFGKSRK